MFFLLFLLWPFAHLGPVYAEPLGVLVPSVKYPVEPLRRHLGGKVVVRISVDKTGKVCDVQFVRGVNPELFLQTVKNVVYRFRFSRGEKDWQTEVTFIFRFPENKNDTNIFYPKSRTMIVVGRPRFDSEKIKHPW